MRIMRNGVRVSMGMEELIELLESDMIDSVIETLINLDDSGIEADFVIAMGSIEVDDDDDYDYDSNGIFFLDPDGHELDFDGIREEIMNRTFSEEIYLSQEELSDKHWVPNPSFLKDHLYAPLNLTEEDFRVKELLNLFSLDEDLDYV